MIVSINVTLPKHEVDRVFAEKLNEYCQDLWIKDDFIWEQVSAGSHSFSAKVAPVNDERYAVVVAAVRLKQLLKK